MTHGLAARQTVHLLFFLAFLLSVPFSVSHAANICGASYEVLTSQTINSADHCAIFGGNSLEIAAGSTVTYDHTNEWSTPFFSDGGKYFFNNGTIAPSASAAEIDRLVLIHNAGIDRFVNTGVIGIEGSAFNPRTAINIEYSQANWVQNTGQIYAKNFGFLIFNSTLNTIINSGEIHTNLVNGEAISINATLPIDNFYVENRGLLEGRYSFRVYNAFGSPPTVANYVTFHNYGFLKGEFSLFHGHLNMYDGAQSEGIIQGGRLFVNYYDSLDLMSDIAAQVVTFNGQAAFVREDRTIDAWAGTSLLNGKLSIADGQTLTLQGDYTQAAGTTLEMGASSTSSYAKLDVTGTATFAPDANLHLDVSNIAVFSENDEMAELIRANTLDATTFNVTDNSFLYDFNAIIAGNAVNIVVSQKANTIEDSVRNQNNSAAIGAGHALDQMMAGTPTGDVANVANAFAALGDEKEVSNAASQTLPVLVGAAPQAMLSHMENTRRIVHARQSTVQGMSSGDGFIEEGHLWLKPFGSWTSQDNRNGVQGFDSRSFGFVVGRDNALTSKWRLGTAFAYSNTKAQSNDYQQELSIDSFSPILYASRKIDHVTELHLQADASYNRSHSERQLNFGGLNRQADARYNSYGVHLGAGVQRRTALTCATDFIYGANLDYSLLYSKKYTEKGAGALNLHVDAQTVDQLVPELTGKIAHQVTKELSVSALAGIGYDLLNSENSIRSSFIGGGGTFVTHGIKPTPWAMRTALGFDYKLRPNANLRVMYEREDRGSHFDNQTLSIKLNMPF